MALTELEPPSTLPRGWYPRRPFRPGCGTVWKAQLACPFFASSASPAGQWISTLRSGGPASSKATFTPGSSLRRAASTHPAEPPPTIT